MTKSNDKHQEQSNKSSLPNKKRRERMLQVASLALLSLIMTSCSNNTKPIEIDYRAINCAGWTKGSLSRKDVLTKETKDWFTSHIVRYAEHCEGK